MFLIEFIRIDNLKHTFNIGNNLEKGWSKKNGGKNLEKMNFTVGG